MTINVATTCAFTGHRALDGTLDEEALKDHIKELIARGYDTFLSGMAMGFDMLAAEKIIELKEQYKNIKLIACLPCPDQEKFYSDEDKARYANIISRCEEVKLVSPHYFRGCMFARDRFMVDSCSYVIGHYRTGGGGTRYTLKYALGHGKDVKIL